jgi:prepilin peptidase CpaA
MFAILGLALFAGLLIYAACSDIARMIIPNWVSIALLVSFPIFALATGMQLSEIGWHLLFGLAILAIGFVLFAFNIFGGGDAKLLAGAAVWTGITAFMPLLYWTLVAGGVMALVLVAARQFVPQAEGYPRFVNHLLKKQNGIPYGVAIMVGGLVALPALPFVLAR